MTSDALSITAAAAALARGDIVAYPTEAVYGLGCDPMNPDAVAALWQLKQRPEAMGLILVASDWSQLAPFVAPLSAAESTRLHRHWPGAHTWVVPAAPSAPRWLTGGRDSLAVRVSAHSVVRALCDAFAGALVSTSANIHGQAPLLQADAVALTFAECTHFAGVVVGALGGQQRPTPIQELLTGQWIRT